MHSDAILLSSQMLSFGSGTVAAAGSIMQMQVRTTAVCNLNKMFNEEKLKIYRWADGHRLAAQLKR